MGEFANMLMQGENDTAAAVCLALSWAALADGNPAESVLRSLYGIVNQWGEQPNLSALFAIAERGVNDDLQLAFELIREEKPPERRQIMQWAIAVVAADGDISPAECLILGFLADLLSQSTTELDELFLRQTGERFPRLADPSSIAWWTRKKQSHRNQGKAKGDRKRDGAQTNDRPSAGQQRRDLEMLGLDGFTTRDEIKTAYRRMAQIHHPDKFVHLGPAAVQMAEARFQSLRAAYERLVNA